MVTVETREFCRRQAVLQGLGARAVAGFSSGSRRIKGSFSLHMQICASPPTALVLGWNEGCVGSPEDSLTTQKNIQPHRIPSRGTEDPALGSPGSEWGAVSGCRDLCAPVLNLNHIPSLPARCLGCDGPKLVPRSRGGTGTNMGHQAQVRVAYKRPHSVIRSAACGKGDRHHRSRSGTHVTVKRATLVLQ